MAVDRRREVTVSAMASGICANVIEDNYNQALPIARVWDDVSDSSGDVMLDFKDAPPYQSASHQSSHPGTSGSAFGTAAPEVTTPEVEESDMFECGICTEELTTPKSLPCLHNFCAQCLDHYFRANKRKGGDRLHCPTCRRETQIPEAGAAGFPTNFHIENIRRRGRQLDVGSTLREALNQLQTRQEDIVEQLSERKRRNLIRINARREALSSRLERYAESLQEALEVQYLEDATRAVDAIQTVKVKLGEMQRQLDTETPASATTDDVIKRTAFGSSTSLDSLSCGDNTTASALSKLQRQVEVITNVSNELAELKTEAEQELSSVLSQGTVFRSGRAPGRKLKAQFGALHVVQADYNQHGVDSWVLHGHHVARSPGDNEDGDDVWREPDDGDGEEEVEGGDGGEREGNFSPLRVRTWSQSWWVLLFAVLPAVILALIVKLIMMVLTKLLD